MPGVLYLLQLIPGDAVRGGRLLGSAGVEDDHEIKQSRNTAQGELSMELGLASMSLGLRVQIHGGHAYDE